MKPFLVLGRGILFSSAIVALMLAGCDSNKPDAPPAKSGVEANSGIDDTPGADDSPGFDADVLEATFLDHVESNREDDGTVNGLAFVDTDGRRVQIRQYNGKRNLVLVFTRGFSGQFCPYCMTQTSRLIANYDKFKERDAEVLLVYPGTKEQLPQFRRAGLAVSEEDRFPFPVLLDEDLVAVNQLGIAAQLASPSTFIIDKQGKVRLSYVGSNPADRPSIQAILDQLDRLQ